MRVLSLFIVVQTYMERHGAKRVSGAKTPDWVKMEIQKGLTAQEPAHSCLPATFKTENYLKL